MIIQPNAGSPRTEGERIIHDATPEQMATATSQLREAGVRIDTDLNPAAGDWAVPQKSVTALDRYGHVDEVAALVSFVGRSGVLVHHRGESDRGWRDKRLSSAHIRSTCRRMTHMLTETANREDNEYTHEQNCARDGRIKRNWARHCVGTCRSRRARPGSLWPLRAGSAISRRCDPNERRTCKCALDNRREYSS